MLVKDVRPARGVTRIVSVAPDGESENGGTVPWYGESAVRGRAGTAERAPPTA
jgi:hypothetical protein